MRTYKGCFVPAVEVLQFPDALKIYVAAPGIRKDSIYVEVQDGQKLVIKGERKARTGCRYLRADIPIGKFQVMMLLPLGVKPESVAASLSGGELEVVVPIPNIEALPELVATKHDVTLEDIHRMEEEERARRVAESNVHEISRDQVRKLEEAERKRRMAEAARTQHDATIWDIHLMEEAERSRRIAESEVHEITREDARRLEEAERQRRIAESEVHEVSREQVRKLEEAERQRRIAESEVHESSRGKVRDMEEAERRRRMAEEPEEHVPISKVNEIEETERQRRIWEHANFQGRVGISFVNWLEEGERKRRMAEEKIVEEHCPISVITVLEDHERRHRTEGLMLKLEDVGREAQLFEAVKEQPFLEARKKAAEGAGV